MDAQDSRVAESSESPARVATLVGIGQGLALFIGGFSLLNLLGELRHRGFDANHWWIDTRPLPSLMGDGLLLLSASLLLAYAVAPRCGAWRWRLTIAATLPLLGLTISNTVTFYILLAPGRITSHLPIAFSIFPGGSLAVILIGLVRCPCPVGWARRRILAMGFTLMICMLAFPLAQIYCFGKTGYARPADAAVVFGARAYADGRPSDALADRVRTACQLHRDGLVRTLVFSGGPGDGPVHETEAMRRMALSLGVPCDAILLDGHGLNTDATVRNTVLLFRQHGITRVLAVSHFYHLPRIKMTYQRQGWEVHTVPARETYTLTQMPYLIAREVVALWAYHLRPLAP